VDGAFSTDRSIDDLMKRWVQIFVRVDLARADRSMTVHRFFRALMMFYVELKCRCRFPSTQRALAKLENVPILFIHGERDTYVPVDLARQLYEAAPGPKAIWICPGAKHNQAVATDPETYHRTLRAFFDRYLASRPGPAEPESPGSVGEAGPVPSATGEPSPAEGPPSAAPTRRPTPAPSPPPEADPPDAVGGPVP